MKSPCGEFRGRELDGEKCKGAKILAILIRYYLSAAVLNKIKYTLFKSFRIGSVTPSFRPVYNNKFI
jgi:hypothetical protein